MLLLFTEVSAETLLIVPTEGLGLFRYDWLIAILLDWKQLHHTQLMSHKALEQILQDYDSLFSDEMGTLKDTQVTIHVKPDAIAHFVRARSIPTRSEIKWIRSFSCSRKLESSTRLISRNGKLPLSQFSRAMALYASVVTTGSQLTKLHFLMLTHCLKWMISQERWLSTHLWWLQGHN